MQIEKHIPAYPLSDFIQHMVYVNGSLSVPFIKELPGGGFNLTIELNENCVNTVYPETIIGKKIDMKNAWFTGTHKQAITYRNNPDSSIMSIRFTPGGFYSLTGIPLTAIDIGIEAEAVLGNSFKHLYQQIINAALVQEKFALIEKFFLRYMINGTIDNSMVTFLQSNINKPIDWLVHKSGYSQKHLIYLLKRHTGFSPKYLKRINRFHQVIKDIQLHKKQTDWFMIMYEHDFYDQAHLIKDFTHFSGISPTEYLKTQLALEINNLVPDMILQPPDKKPK